MADSRCIQKDHLATAVQQLTKEVAGIESLILSFRQEKKPTADLNKKHTRSIASLTKSLRSLAENALCQMRIKAFFSEMKSKDVSDDKRHPSNQDYINTYDNLSLLILFDIMEKSDLSHATLVIKRWKNVMQKCLKGNDYFTFGAIEIALAYLPKALINLCSTETKEFIAAIKIDRVSLFQLMEAKYESNPNVVPNVFDFLKFKEEVLDDIIEEMKVLDAAKREVVSAGLIKKYEYMFDKMKNDFQQNVVIDSLRDISQILIMPRNIDGLESYTENSVINQVYKAKFKDFSDLMTKLEAEVEQLQQYHLKGQTYLDKLSKKKQKKAKSGKSDTEKMQLSYDAIFQPIGRKDMNYVDKKIAIERLGDADVVAANEYLFDEDLANRKINILKTLDAIVTYDNIIAKLKESLFESRQPSPKPSPVMKIRKKSHKKMSKMLKSSTDSSLTPRSSDGDSGASDSSMSFTDTLLTPRTPRVPATILEEQEESVEIINQYGTEQSNINVSSATIVEPVPILNLRLAMKESILLGSASSPDLPSYIDKHSLSPLKQREGSHLVATLIDTFSSPRKKEIIEKPPSPTEKEARDAQIVTSMISKQQHPIFGAVKSPRLESLAHGNIKSNSNK